MTFAEELAVEEYKSLRHEIDALTSESRLLVRLSLTGAAAIYAWLAVQIANDFVREVMRD